MHIVSGCIHVLKYLPSPNTSEFFLQQQNLILKKFTATCRSKGNVLVTLDICRTVFVKTIFHEKLGDSEA